MFSGDERNLERIEGNVGGEEVGSGDRPVFGGNFPEKKEETVGYRWVWPQEKVSVLGLFVYFFLVYKLCY